MPFVHCGRYVSPTKGCFDLMARLLKVLSGDAKIICCGGSSPDFMITLDENPGRKTCVQYPFTLTPLQFERLLHKPSFSVMGTIDMCSMLRTLLLRVNGLLDERWEQSTHYFRMTRLGNIFLLLP